MESLSKAHETLRQIRIFMDFDEPELESFIEFVDPVRVRKGEVLLRQGEFAPGMFIVMEGQLQAIVTLKDGSQHVFSTLKQGDFIGELSLIDEYPRSADLVAIEDGVLLRITSQVVETFFEIYPSAAYKILLGISRDLLRRLRHSDQQLLDFKSSSK